MTNQQPPGPSAWQAPPEVAGPAPGVEWAGYGERLVAYVVDVLVLLVVFVALAIVFVAVMIGGLDFSDPRDPKLTGAAIGAILLFTFALIVVSLLYFPLFWAQGGQTPGMRIFGIRVVSDHDGRPIGWGKALLRSIGYWVSAAVFYIGYAWMFVDDRRRGWHDLIAGTVVVKDAGR